MSSLIFPAGSSLSSSYVCNFAKTYIYLSFLIRNYRNFLCLSMCLSPRININNEVELLFFFFFFLYTIFFFLLILFFSPVIVEPIFSYGVISYLRIPLGQGCILRARLCPNTILYYDIDIYFL